MENYSDVLRRVLNQITLELTTAEMDLNKINLSKDFMQYKTDILRLADSDVNLLANYYMESTGEKKDSFSWLLEKSIPDKNFRLYPGTLRGTDEWNKLSLQVLLNFLLS